MTCSLGTLAAASEAQATVTVTVEGMMFSAAEVAAAETDIDPANDSASEKTNVVTSFHIFSDAF